jgi:hypothetical protein
VATSEEAGRLAASTWALQRRRYGGKLLVQLPHRALAAPRFEERPSGGYSTRGALIPLARLVA